MLTKLCFLSSTAALYILTLGTISSVLYSSHLFGTPVWATEKPATVTQKPIKLPPKVISGKPVRIAIPDAQIDLPVIDGIYDASTGAWTLSDTAAHFALITTPANNHAGTTFIYGHGTGAVFGKIGTNRPALGTTAVVHTDTNKVFSYSLESIHDAKPSDTSIFADVTNGPPRLVVQTCTGVFSEWRTMFIFSFKGVSE